MTTTINTQAALLLHRERVQDALRNATTRPASKANAALPADQSQPAPAARLTQTTPTSLPPSPQQGAPPGALLCVLETPAPGGAVHPTRGRQFSVDTAARGAATLVRARSERPVDFTTRPDRSSRHVHVLQHDRCQ